MKYAVISFTSKGSSLNKVICRTLENKGHSVQGFSIFKYVKDTGLTGFVKLSELLIELFPTVDGIIFISACGIAVRGIAPLLKNKGVDPGIIVLDDGGNHVISLLSGHLGGGNDLCLLVSEMIGARPVITTATDVNDVFSVDSFAKENGLWIDKLSKIKEVSARILEGEKISLYSEYPINGKLPEQLTLSPLETGICISKNPDLAQYPNTINLIPRDLVLGIGCKKNTSLEAIDTLANEVMEQLGFYKYRIGKIASIDVKAMEPGILEFAKNIKAEFVTYSADELNNVPGDFSSSSFVEQTVGVGNVCERSGAIASGFGKKLLGKTPKNGVTISLYQRVFAIDFHHISGEK